MKGWLIKYLVLMALIIGVYIYAESQRPPVINWAPTLSNRDKIPYGTEILYASLEKMLGQKPVELRVPVYDQVNNSEDSGQVYLLVAGGLETTKTDEIELLRYIARGNTVLMASEGFSKSLRDTLRLGLRTYSFSDDSVRLRLVNPALDSSSWYAMNEHTVDGYFNKLDTNRAEILGMNSDGQVNFVRYRIGNGQLLLHAAPLAFTNYFILKDGNAAYLENLFAYLPYRPTAVYWDEYYKIGRGGDSTPLRVILTKPPLKAAYFIALAAIWLYVLFQTKRRQRIIPVIERPRNESMDFVETVSRVYFNQGDHGLIARKKLFYLLEHFRSRYSLQTQWLDEAFETRLSQKSGYPKEKVATLVQAINQVRQEHPMNADELLHFSGLIDEFYKHEHA